MPGFDATGPSGQGPMTGGRRGPCSGSEALVPPYRGGGARRHLFRITGLTGWERAARVAALRTEPEDLAASLGRIDRWLHEVRQRLERLEAKGRD